MQALTTLDVLQTKVKESEDMVQTLIQEVDRLNKVNLRHHILWIHYLSDCGALPVPSI